jgi:hypothetical protein
MTALLLAKSFAHRSSHQVVRFAWHMMLFILIMHKVMSILWHQNPVTRLYSSTLKPVVETVVL